MIYLVLALVARLGFLLVAAAVILKLSKIKKCETPLRYAYVRQSSAIPVLGSPPSHSKWDAPKWTLTAEAVES